MKNDTTLDPPPSPSEKENVATATKIKKIEAQITEDLNSNGTKKEKPNGKHSLYPMLAILMEEQKQKEVAKDKDMVEVEEIGAVDDK